MHHVKAHQLKVIAAIMPILLMLSVAVRADALGISRSGKQRSATGQEVNTAASCVAQHVLCDGHWEKVDGRRLFRYDTPVTISASGSITAQSASVTSTQTTTTDDGTLSPAESEIPASPPGPELGSGQEKNAGDNKCWTSLGGTENGDPAELWDCDQQPNQTWIVWASALGGAPIFFQNDGDSKCLNNSNGAAANNNPETMWGCAWGNNEAYAPTTSPQWGFNAQGGNIPYALSSLGATNNGAPLVIYAENHGPNQVWAGAFNGY